MGAEYTESQIKATKKYMENMHTIKVVVTKEKADEYKNFAKEKSFSSLNKFIIDCIEKGMK